LQTHPEIGVWHDLGMRLRGRCRVSLLTLLTFFLTISLASPTHARVDNYGNPIPNDSYAVIYDSGSMVFHPATNWSSPPGRQPGQYGIQISLPVCEKESEVDCISTLNYSDDSGKAVKGVFDSYLPITWDGFFAGCEGNGCAPMTPPWKFSKGKVATKADLQRRIPIGSKPSLWTFPGLRHSGGDKYLVSFAIQGLMSNQSAPLDKGSIALWSGGAINIEITPVVVESNANWESIDPWARSYAIPQQGLWNEANLWCFSGELAGDLYCIRRVTENSTRTFELKARLNYLADAFASHAFMVSRTLGARVSSKKSSDLLELSFAGSTSPVSSAIGYLPRNEFGFREMIRATNKSYRESGVTNPQLDENKLSGCDPKSKEECVDFQNWITNASGQSEDGSSPGAIGSWSSYEKVIDFKPVRSSSVWFFRSAGILSTDFTWLTSCKKEIGVSGVISSNATVMKPTPPSWNSQERSLDFKIGSPHLDESGKVSSGFYNLAISESVAKCLWGKDVTAAKANISVINDDGEVKTFTSSMKVANGYLNFQVAGFTYSVNKISIAFDKVSATANSSPAKLKTITCKKGKVTKTVSNKSSKCPNGFKKVA
jgi:hypothetical protein